jgi:hypothetical protein
VTIEQLEKEMPPTVTVQQAAEIMAVTPQFLRLAIMEQKFPFAVGVKMEQNVYYINTRRFIKWMKGEM